MRLRVVPALLVDEEDVLGLRQQLERRHLVLAEAPVLALERRPLAAPGVGIKAHAHVDLAHVRVDGDEPGPRVAVGLARLPARRRRDRRVVVLEQHHVVGVDEVDEGAVVLVQLPGAGLERPRVGDLERAAQGGLRPVHLDRRDDGVDLGRLAAVAGRKQEDPCQGGGHRQPPGTAECHALSPRGGLQDEPEPAPKPDKDTGERPGRANCTKGGSRRCSGEMACYPPPTGAETGGVD